jgi:hypothetical protein
MDKIAHPFVFQCDSSIVKSAYENNDNFLIEYDFSQNNSYCAIYFSSNYIYYPNTEESFTSSIIKKNKYEWYGTRVPYAYKHIFIRDIQKQWYLTGINGKYNSPDKLLSFLQAETKEYKVITLGSSAGGFAAVLYGSLLKASLILSFNGQFEIKSLLETSSEEMDPVLFRTCKNKNLYKFFDTKKFISEGLNIFYFYSAKSSWDCKQKEHIEDINLNVITFKTNHHGVPFLKCNLPVILAKPLNELNLYSGKAYNPVLFSLQLVGLKETMKGLFNQVVKRYFH